MKKICIDTADNTIIKVSLLIDQKGFYITREVPTHRAQIVLVLIRELLDKHDLSLQDITLLSVNPGPGSFTGVRVGVAIANALAYALKIPVNGISFKENASLIEPTYTA